MIYPLVIARRLLHTLIFILHSILIALTVLCFLSEAGTTLEALSLATNFIALILIVYIQLDRCMHTGAEPDNIINMVTFGLLWIDGLVGSIALSVRAHADGNQGLFEDYAHVKNGHSVALALLSLSWLATPTAVAGLVVSYCDKLPGVPEVKERHVSEFEMTRRGDSANVRSQGSLPFQMPPTHHNAHTIYTEAPTRKQRGHGSPPRKLGHHGPWETIPV